MSGHTVTAQDNPGGRPARSVSDRQDAGPGGTHNFDRDTRHRVPQFHLYLPDSPFRSFHARLSGTTPSAFASINHTWHCLRNCQLRKIQDAHTI